MSKNNAKKDAWQTKYGMRRVRQDLPSLGEAIEAARGLTDDFAEQAEIAASLMGLPYEQVHAEVVKAGPVKKPAIQPLAFVGPASAPRAVVVERKPSRRIGSPIVVTSTDRPSLPSDRPLLRPRGTLTARVSR